MSFDDMIAPPVQAEPAPAPARKTVRKGAVVVGGLPSVSLLPPEILSAARGRTLRRGMVALVLAAVVAAGGSTALAMSSQSAAEQQLAAETAQTGALQVQVSKFADVQRLQSSVALGEAAVRVGSSTEVDWNARLADVLADMPYGWTVNTISADSASPLVDYPQGSDPLEKPRAVSIQVTLTAPTIAPLSPWLRELRSIPAYADATASYTKGDTSGYTATVVLHLGADAIEKQQQGSGS